MNPAARVTDLAAHAGVPSGIVAVGQADLLIESQPAANIGAQVACSGVGNQLHPATAAPITTGAATVLLHRQPLARITSIVVCGALVSAGAPTVLVGGASGGRRRTLKVRPIIVKGTYWDTPQGRANLENQLLQAEIILGYNIEHDGFETVDDASLKDIDPAPFGAERYYSAEEVALSNKYGSDDRIPMIMTDNCVASGVAVRKGDANANDGLVHEGVFVDNSYKDNENVVAHELGHVLSDERGGHMHAETTDPDNVMHPNALGKKWTDPWKSSAEKNSPYLK